MKNIILCIATIFFLSPQMSGQEKYGKTANLGVGVGYYGYLNRSVPALYFNYESEAYPPYILIMNSMWLKI